MTSIEEYSEKKILEDLEQSNIDSLYQYLLKLDKAGGYRYRTNIMVPFHKAVLRVFFSYGSSGNQHNHDVRWLFSKLFDIAQRPYFWQKDTFEDNSFLNDYKSAENFLLELMHELDQSDNGKKLLDWLEESYQLVTKTVGFCLGQYAFVEAYKITRLKSSNFVSALFKIVFRLPLFAGIIVGWLFLLQAGDAIKYFTLILDEYYQISVLFVVTAVLLSVSGSYIYFQGVKKAADRLLVKSGGIIVLSWSISCIVGLVMIKWFGFAWFKTINKDLGLCASQLETYATYFWLMWTSMAVFIGIFAQVIWSGRGPTQFDEE